METTETGLDFLSRIIRQRRSIKPVDMDPERGVDRSLLTEILENANWAPTHGLTEPWRFAICQGAARQELSETMQRIYRETTPAAEFREDKLRKMSENPLRSPVVIVVWMERRGRSEDSGTGGNRSHGLRDAEPATQRERGGAGRLLVHSPAGLHAAVCAMADHPAGGPVPRFVLPGLAEGGSQTAGERAASGG